MKMCSKCKQEKPLSEFSPKRGTRLGVQSSCKACGRQYARRYYERNKDRVRERADKIQRVLNYIKDPDNTQGFAPMIGYWLWNGFTEKEVAKIMLDTYQILLKEEV